MAARHPAGRWARPEQRSAIGHISRHRRRQVVYWFKRVRPIWLLALCLAVQALTYAAAGLLVAAAADKAIDISHTGARLLLGIACGLVPHELAAIPLPPGVSYDVRNPRSWLGRLLNWITALLDFRAEIQGTHKAEQLSPQDLIDLTWDLYWKSYFTDSSVPAASKSAQYDLLREGVAQIEGGVDVADGMGRLWNFCIGEIKRRYIGS